MNYTAPLDSTRHQVLVGLIISGPYTWCPHYTPNSLAFYRAMAADGLVTEEGLADTGSRFTITPEGERLAREASRTLAASRR